jgi:hypothetical protein
MNLSVFGATGVVGREVIIRPSTPATTISALGPSLDRKATGMPLVDAMRAERVERYIGMQPSSVAGACPVSPRTAACRPWEPARTGRSRTYPCCLG